MRKAKRDRIGGSVNLMIAGILLLVFGTAALGRVVYVDRDAVGVNDGSSWADAFNYLQDALMFASSGDEIRVAEGVYRPDEFLLSDRPNLGRAETFQLMDGVAIRGGYAGFGQPDPGARDCEIYHTILSGDREENDTDTVDTSNPWEEATRVDNCFHVLTGSGIGPETIIDGLCIVAGEASPGHVGGGGMLIVQGNPTIVDCVFEDNCSVSGGSILIEVGSPIISRCTFVENCSFGGGRGGGGIYIEHGSPVISGCTFKDNYAACDGGGVWSEYSSPTITNCRFVHNYAGDDAGAVYCSQGGKPVITGNEMIDNTANDDGGAIYCSKQCDALITDNLFTANLARNGGAIGLKKFPKATIVGNVLAGNEVLCNGGGIYCRYSTCEIRGNVIKENVAPDDGGGLFFSVDVYVPPMTAGESNVVENVIVGNRAGDNGGGIYCGNSSPTFANNLIVCNYAEDGGGFWCRESTPVISNCTISDNMATEDGGGIVCRWEAVPKVVNSIIWGNDAGTFGQIALLDDTVIVVESSDVQGGWAGEGNLDADPLFDGTERGTIKVYDILDDPGASGGERPFISVALTDYHLRSAGGRWNPESRAWTIDDVTSPCIDAGGMTGPVILEAFPNGGVVNLGAYGGTAEASKSYFGVNPCEVIVAGDINGDCTVNLEDLSFMVVHWLESHVQNLVAIPDVVGLLQADAETAISNAGLVMGTVFEEFSDTVAAGYVMTQTPVGDQLVRHGSAVNLIVSGRTSLTMLPDVIGSSRVEAEAAILIAGLVVGTVSEEFSETIPAGYVMTQSPVGAQLVRYRSAVNLIISSGNAPTIVPDVIGLSRAEAEAAIVSAGLVVGTVSEEFSESIPAAYVMAQTPAAAQVTGYGSAVNLVISKGIAPTTVPDVIGLSQAEAEAALVSAGLVVGTVSEEFSEITVAGNVVSQSQSAGEQLAPGAILDLVVSKGFHMVLVPAGAFAYQNASPEDYVYVDSFAIGKYEVTNAAYCEFLNAADPASNHWDPHQDWGGGLVTEIMRIGDPEAYTYKVSAGREHHPVRNVSYYDAVAFAEWRSHMEGKTYRLPTQQEWEKAAGWDPDLQKLWEYCCQQDFIWSAWANFDYSYGGPLPIGSFNGTGGKQDAHSYYGCYDMSGNVAEWTSSVHINDSERLSIRGGCWYSALGTCSVTHLGMSFTPSMTGGGAGFRLVLEL